MNHQPGKKKVETVKDSLKINKIEEIERVLTSSFFFFGRGIVGRTNGWEEKCKGSNKKITQKMRLKIKGCMKNKVRVRNNYEGRRVKMRRGRLNKM